MRRAAATRKPPDPEAGSQTVRPRSRCSACSGLSAFLTASLRSGSSVVSSKADTSAGGV